MESQAAEEAKRHRWVDQNPLGLSNGRDGVYFF
jgi:hypothetical protein